MTQDLSRWRELRRIASSYVVWDEITREGALFDVSDVDTMGKLIESESIQLRHVFLTHEHSVDALRARFPKFFLHTNSKNAPPQHRNRPNDFIHLGSLRITNRGLVDDKVAYVIGNWPEDAPHAVIAGDIENIPKEIIAEKILNLPTDSVICLANGTITTVAQLAGGLNFPPR